MATVAREVVAGKAGEARRRPTLRQMIAERDRLTAESGHYCGITELTLRDADPIKYERFYAKLHSAVLAARESARLSPPVPARAQWVNVGGGSPRLQAIRWRSP